MDRKEINELFEQNVRYMRQNIPPDDIYPFAEATFMAALFFLRQWNNSINLHAIMRDDLIAKKYINNIMLYLRARDLGLPIALDLGILEEE
jgi:hypothetical protein